jgi:hypothetical protein
MLPKVLGKLKLVNLDLHSEVVSRPAALILNPGGGGAGKLPPKTPSPQDFTIQKFNGQFLKPPGTADATLVFLKHATS